MALDLKREAFKQIWQPSIVPEEKACSLHENAAIESMQLKPAKSTSFGLALGNRNQEDYSFAIRSSPTRVPTTMTLLLMGRVPGTSSVM